MYSLKFIRFFYTNYKIQKYKIKAQYYTDLATKLEDIVNLGFASEKEFNERLQTKWNKVKREPKDLVKDLKNNKDRVKKMAGIGGKKTGSVEKTVLYIPKEEE